MSTAIDVFNLPVHPAADVLPMLDPDELKDLAADIKAHGLQKPVLVCDGVLIDGRNRLAACKLVGITPDVKDVTGCDPVGRMLSENIQRRNLSTSQQAMGIAILVPKSHQGKKKKCSISEEVSPTRLSMARTILKHTPHFSELIMKGCMTLDDAYEQARTTKKIAADEKAQMKVLKTGHPGLYERVVNEKLTLQAAITEGQQRDKAAKLNRAVLLRGVRDAVKWLDAIANDLTREETLNAMVWNDDVVEILAFSEEVALSKMAEGIESLKLLLQEREQ